MRTGEQPLIKYTYPADYETFSEGAVLAGHFDMDDSYFIKRSKGMTDWLITYTISGDGYFITPDGERACGPGDIVLLRSRTPHHYGTKKDSHWNFLWAHFPERMTETNLLPQEELLVYQVDNVVTQKRIVRLLEKTLADSIERKAFWNELCMNYVRELLLLLAQRLHSGYDPRIEEVLHLLSRRMRETIRIDDLASAVGLSASRLSHLFKEQTGRTIVEELNTMRLQQAALLLVHTHRSASEIALDVGYANYNHFANLFKAQYGATPREFRERRV